MKNNPFAPSALQKIQFEGREFYIKRDDLLDNEFSGNKARKFYSYLVNDFPGLTKLIGYGSVQANSLYSLAALAKIKGWSFDYYVTNIPNWLAKSPLGNYEKALSLRANIIAVGKQSVNLDSFMQDQYHSIHKKDKSVLFIPEGGRCEYAQQGVELLALELKQQCDELALIKPMVMLPAGTGTTALYLQKYSDFDVFTCPCVGDQTYLKQQFLMLEKQEKYWPTMLTADKKYHFGKCYQEFYDLWLKLKQQTNIEFDLLYDPLGWINLLSYIKSQEDQRPVIYIHQGGLAGNISMLNRYKRMTQRS